MSQRTPQLSRVVACRTKLSLAPVVQQQVSVYSV